LIKQNCFSIFEIVHFATLAFVQSTHGLNTVYNPGSIQQIISIKVDIPGRPIHIAVTGDQYIGKTTIVNHIVRNRGSRKIIKQHATASKLTLSTSLKVWLNLFIGF